MSGICTAVAADDLLKLRIAAVRISGYHIKAAAEPFPDCGGKPQRIDIGAEADDLFREIQVSYSCFFVLLCILFGVTVETIVYFSHSGIAFIIQTML